MKWFRYDVMIKINKGNKKKNGSSTNKKNVIYSAKEILECMEKIKEIR